MKSRKRRLWTAALMILTLTLAAVLTACGGGNATPSPTPTTTTTPGGGDGEQETPVVITTSEAWDKAIADALGELDKLGQADANFTLEIESRETYIDGSGDSYKEKLTVDGNKAKQVREDREGNISTSFHEIEEGEKALLYGSGIEEAIELLKGHFDWFEYREGKYYLKEGNGVDFNTAIGNDGFSRIDCGNSYVKFDNGVLVEISLSFEWLYEGHTTEKSQRTIKFAFGGQTVEIPE